MEIISKQKNLAKDAAQLVLVMETKRLDHVMQMSNAISSTVKLMNVKNSNGEDVKELETTTSQLKNANRNVPAITPNVLFAQS